MRPTSDNVMILKLKLLTDAEQQKKIIWIDAFFMEFSVSLATEVGGWTMDISPFDALRMWVAHVSFLHYFQLYTHCVHPFGRFVTFCSIALFLFAVVIFPLRGQNANFIS